MNTANSSLATKQCKPCEGGAPSLSSAEITKLMQQLEGWDLFDRLIGKVYNFTNYYQTMAFVNAVAWISHREDHHPDIILSYNKCRVEYTTHAVGGLSENDFICAAKIDVLFKI
ncbi:MAG: 4a-hydroxytetrahydrobiopterin dehydratase [Nitrosomonadaceae bacterium]